MNDPEDNDPDQMGERDPDLWDDGDGGADMWDLNPEDDD